jgi:acetyl esterase/lipase
MSRSRPVPPLRSALRPRATIGLPRWVAGAGALLAAGPSLAAQETTTDVPYVAAGHPRQVLDIARPAGGARELPVMFWIHGGGWQRGDKSDVGIKPQVLTDRGFVFVSTNYRLLPEVGMEELVGDVAAALGWVHRHIAAHGGDPGRIFVGGHSAGAQLAALLCTDERYLGKEGVPFTALRGCVPVDGDTFDIPKVIQTAEFRQALYGSPQPTFGHRQKFGNCPLMHVDFSAVTHVAAGKHIPPFLILYFSGHPETSAQAVRLESVLRSAGVPARALGKADTNHRRLNDDLGRADDPITATWLEFVEDPVGTARP